MIQHIKDQLIEVVTLTADYALAGTIINDSRADHIRVIPYFTENNSTACLFVLRKLRGAVYEEEASATEEIAPGVYNLKEKEYRIDAARVDLTHQFALGVNLGGMETIQVWVKSENNPAPNPFGTVSLRIENYKVTG